MRELMEFTLGANAMMWGLAGYRVWLYWYDRYLALFCFAITGLSVVTGVLLSGWLK